MMFAPSQLPPSLRDIGGLCCLRRGAARLVDAAVVVAAGGRGGSGSASEEARTRGKRVRDGGDGGDGGDCVIVGDGGLPLDLRGLRRRLKAGNGGGGREAKMKGKNGKDDVERVPLGTALYRRRTFYEDDGERGNEGSQRGDLLAEILSHGQRLTLARGGKGGRGSARMGKAGPTPGEEGEEIGVDVELRMMAQIGLLGAPNAGKSSLLQCLTNARPKVASYAFSTTRPSLGRLLPPAILGSAVGERLASSFLPPVIVADLPGLIEGAAQGRGLGYKFLKHASHCSALLIVLDMAAGTREGVPEKFPWQQLEEMEGELRSYAGGELLNTPCIIVANKMDLEKTENAVAKLRRHTKLPIFSVSALNGDGVDKLATSLHLIIDERNGELIDSHIKHRILGALKSLEV